MAQGGVVPQEEWKDAMIIVLQKEEDRTESDNFRGISLVAHAGKMLKAIANCLMSNYCEQRDILPEEQCGLRPQRSTINIYNLRGPRRLHQLERKKSTPLDMCFVDLT